MLTLVVGVGNPWRGDDAAGLEVADRVRARARDVAVETLEGDASALVHLWAGHDDVALVDAASSGAPPGTLHELRDGDGTLQAAALRSSTHAFGVADAVGLAAALGPVAGAPGDLRDRGRGLLARGAALAGGRTDRRRARERGSPGTTACAGLRMSGARRSERTRACQTTVPGCRLAPAASTPCCNALRRHAAARATSASDSRGTARGVAEFGHELGSGQARRIKRPCR